MAEMQITQEQLSAKARQERYFIAELARTAM
jgi:hypothetical protein